MSTRLAVIGGDGIGPEVVEVGLRVLDAVREHGADIGLAFDGDADRCFVIDENGDPVSPSAITASAPATESSVATIS